MQAPCAPPLDCLDHQADDRQHEACSGQDRGEDVMSQDIGTPQTYGLEAFSWVLNRSPDDGP
jgi:hypothetical protein